MRLALENARLEPRKIDLINAHGTSTPLGDLSECIAINNIFGEYATQVPVQGTKSMIGHALGGAGALAAIAASWLWKEGSHTIP